MHNDIIIAGILECLIRLKVNAFLFVKVTLAKIKILFKVRSSKFYCPGACTSLFLFVFVFKQLHDTHIEQINITLVVIQETKHFIIEMGPSKRLTEWHCKTLNAILHEELIGEKVLLTKLYLLRFK